MSDYQSLIERVEGLSGGDPETDRTIHEVVTGECTHRETRYYFIEDGNDYDSGFTCVACGKDTHGNRKWPAYSHSIDAAVSLVERKLPDAYPKFEKSGGTSWHAWIMDEPEAEQGYYGINSSPALAILAALLRALQSQEEGR